MFPLTLIRKCGDVLPLHMSVRSFSQGLGRGFTVRAYSTSPVSSTWIQMEWWLSPTHCSLTVGLSKPVCVGLISQVHKHCLTTVNPAYRRHMESMTGHTGQWQGQAVPKQRADCFDS